MLSEITDDIYKKKIMFLLNNNWTGRTDYYFPAQTSVNLEKCHFTKLQNYNYRFAIKNTIDYKRGILFNFIDSSAENKSAVIFKDFSIYYININCSHEYFYGSIFDISFSDKEIIICDTFMASGNKVNTLSYVDRMSEASYFINSLVESDIKIKTLDYSHDINLFSNIDDNEELFIIPNNLPITTGINYSCFKWKPSDRYSFNLSVSENESDIDVYTTNFKKLKLFAKIKWDTPEGKEQIEQIKSLDNYKNGCMIRFNLDLSNNKIIIEGVDTDKTIPTTIRSVEKILHIKRENITFQEISAY